MKRILSLSLVTLAFSASCEKKAPSETQALPSARPAASASAGKAVPAKPTLAGNWAGSYDAKPFRIEVANSGVREWAKDEGKTHIGPGKLNLNVADDGSISGKLDGPLGALIANGRLEGDTLRADLLPASDDGFRGLLVGDKQGEAIQGYIQASTGDSLTVRKASFELKKSN